MNVLIIDDHPLIIDAYKSALTNIYAKKINFKICHNCEEAYVALETINNTSNSYDLAIIDFNLPPYKPAGLFTGADVALYLKKKNPNSKIIIITAHTEVIIIYDIYKKVNPEGLIIKNEITPLNLPEIIHSIINGEVYQSPHIKNSVKEIWKKELMVEDYNRLILFYLSKGYKIKDLEEVVPLAGSTIQRRIINMKKAFNVSDDSSLVKDAIEQNFI